jgi:small subunit ribosomal protein S17
MARTKKGVVVRDKNDKTIAVEVVRYVEHPKYKKRFRKAKRFYADDPTNKFKIGDTVTIYETKPLSKMKRWTVVPPKKAKDSKTTSNITT